MWGGLGQAPKFPSPYLFEMLWRGWLRDRDKARLFQSVTVTLDRMCQGGIYDHLGGGFARYATDNEWLIPHFEKMLYDNAQLVDLLTLVWQETKSPLYATRIAETCDWVLREMVAEGGGFAATYDADLEGVEGKFYVWDEAEIDAVLGDDAAFFKQVYDVTAQGNWEHHNILHRNRAPALLSEAEEQRLAGLRAKLKAVRDKRVWPGWDDKVLADWNGLMIAALANAAVVFQRDDWLAAAERAWRFVMDRMRDEDGRLFHSWRIGKRLHRGTLDDYANMARAGIALFEATGEPRYLDEVKSLVSGARPPFRRHCGRRLFHHRRRRRRPDRAHQALPRQCSTGRQRHAGRRVRAAVGAGRRRGLARQGRAPARRLRRRAGRQLLPADDPAQRLRAAAARDRAGDRGRPGLEPRPRRCGVRSICKACPTRSSGACRRILPCPRIIRPPARAWSVGKPALYVCQDMSCRAPIVDATKVVLG